jgi:hypothetical protein
LIATEKRGTAMGQFCKAIVATRILLLLGMSVTTPAAAASFDGAWSVRIASSNGVLPNGASVSIGISNGQVESGDGNFTASGHVAEAGSISVTLSSGAKRAVGYGRLTGTSGSGTWRGAMCSGTWTAQRI